ncbi:MAG: hypothetical protein HY294_13165 [Candidatus Rokubacteria bacterium]|nr:hypothetical protein [Candidatus Rokubacteria bacterium]MBI3826942.1 hypothetical protein [Candidatus Rokubacteria bacterium]
MVVETFERLYHEYELPVDHPLYGVPRRGVPAREATRRYRGIDREPLEPFAAGAAGLVASGVLPPPAEEGAQRRLAEFEEEGRALEDFVLDGEAALPRRLGFDATWFSGDQRFSGILPVVRVGRNG